MKKTFVIFIMLFFATLTLVNAQVFITEIADPNNNAGGRYIELYNAGATAVDFTEGSNWRIDKYTNASATVSQTLNLTGTIPAGGFYIIATGPVDGDFLTLYGVDADQFDGFDNDVAGSNGDDNLELYDGTGALVDQFGVPGEDGSGTTHEFEDGRAERVAAVTSGNILWDSAEWYIDSDAPTGDGPQDAPGGFDPGVWNPVAPIVATPIVVTIYEIQYTDSTNGDSPYADSLVTTTGIVTAVAGSGFYMQDSAKSWNGIYVNTSDYSVALGDSVDVTGTVTENYNFTIITNISDVTNNGAGILPVATVVTTGEASSEMYESVLLTTTGVCDNADLGYGEWSINDGSGTVRFNDDIFAVTPTLDWIYEVTGPMSYSYSNFKILPRDAGDVVETEVLPPTNDLSLTFEDDSDVANWSHWDETNLWTAEAQNATAGVGGSGALELGDAGYGMIAKRKVYTTTGTYFSLSVDIKTQGWGTPETYKLFLYAQGFAILDSVQINSDAGYTTFTIDGIATSDSGYIKIAGDNVLGQNYVWVDNLLFDDDAPAPIVQNELFFSEYIEGSGDNKALEIYNGTGAEVDLSNYIIRSNYNGNPFNEVFTFGANAKLAAGDVYILAHADADVALTSVADTLIQNPYAGGTSYMTVFNGDDVRALCKVNGTDTTIVDIIGANDGVDPGSGWPVAGIDAATANHTLVRKETVLTGNPDWTASSGTTTEDSEWIVYDVDTFIYFGQHPGETPVVELNLFFSEYIEGSGDNKALEIYNGTGAEVDLSNYIIRSNYNGNPFNEVFNFGANAKLAVGDVYILSHADADVALTSVADTLIQNPYAGGTSYMTVFNGDDVRALCKVNGTDTTIVDIIGANDGVDPGSGWPVAGIDAATANHTLVRKETVLTGNPDWTASSGTTTEDSEWIVYDVDTFIYFGQHPGSRVLVTPEPSEYATNLLAVGQGTSILLTWTDAAGTNLPDGYLGYVSTSPAFTAPVDGIPVEDSLDVMNIPYGLETVLITGLEEETLYYFTLYPYSNSGTDIDYKTDGTVPLTSGTTGVAPNPILFSNFETSLGDWTPYSVASTNGWVHATGTGANTTGGFAQMNGYQEDELSNDYLIAGPFNFDNFSDEFMEFWASTKYGDFNAELTLEYSIDYDGSADPSTFTWTELTFTRPLDNDDVWSPSGTIALDGIVSDAVYFAFHYQSNGTQGRWKIDEVGIYGTPADGVDLPPAIESVVRNVNVPNADENTEVTATVTDDNGLAGVNLVYSTDGIVLSTVAMSNTEGDTWVAEVVASTYNDGDLFGYFVTALDIAGQTDTSDVSMVFAGNTPIENVKRQAENGAIEFIGAAARITGTVSAGTGTYSTGRIEAYVEDGTAGILVIKFGTETPAMVENNSYTVTGKILEYNGLAEIEPFDAEVDIIDNGATTALEPLLLTIAEVNSDPELYEGRLIRINSVGLSSETPWLGTGSSGTTMDIFVGTDTLALRVDADTDIWGTTSPEFPQDIIGVLGQYYDYQLLPRRLTDFETGTGVNGENGIPTVYALQQNYPNPFNPTTKINFSLPESGMVTIKVYDILGKEVMTLVNEVMPASHHSVEFDASQLSTGIYMYRIQANDFVSVKKMMLIK